MRFEWDKQTMLSFLRGAGSNGHSANIIATPLSPSPYDEPLTGLFTFSYPTPSTLRSDDVVVIERAVCVYRLS